MIYEHQMLCIGRLKGKKEKKENIFFTIAFYINSIKILSVKYIYIIVATRIITSKAPNIKQKIVTVL
jgi:hypothetical protein